MTRAGTITDISRCQESRGRSSVRERSRFPGGQGFPGRDQSGQIESKPAERRPCGGLEQVCAHLPRGGASVPGARVQKLEIGLLDRNDSAHNPLLEDADPGLESEDDGRRMSGPLLAALLLLLPWLLPGSRPRPLEEPDHGHAIQLLGHVERCAPVVVLDLGIGALVEQ